VITKWALVIDCLSPSIVASGLPFRRGIDPAMIWRRLSGAIPPSISEYEPSEAALAYNVLPPNGVDLAESAEP
jgi:hypothetical protein